MFFSLFVYTASKKLSFIIYHAAPRPAPPAAPKPAPAAAPKPAPAAAPKPAPAPAAKLAPTQGAYIVPTKMSAFQSSTACQYVPSYGGNSQYVPSDEHTCLCE